MTTVAAAGPDSFRVVSNLLGGNGVLRTTPRSTVDWIGIIRKGIPTAAMDALTKAMKVSQSELARALGIPDRTLARRKREGIFSSDESAKLLRLARAVGRANEVFENAEAALHWLKTPNATLSGASPLSVLDTEIGAESVMDTLGRIAQGVYS